MEDYSEGAANLRKLQRPAEPRIQCEFSLDHYEDILRMAVDLGYVFRSFLDESIGPEGVILLRHDIDISMERALAMAELEAVYGIRSTFFFLPDCPLYGPFEPAHQESLRTIAELGHWLGLHLNAPQDADLQALCDIWYRRMREILPVIPVVSFHRPKLPLVGVLRGFTCTYEERFFKHIRYISDSSKEWRDGCICEHFQTVSGAALPSLQLLTHPVWWPRSAEMSFSETRAAIVAKRVDECDEFLREMDPFRWLSESGERSRNA
jgi:hypothetical protein